MCRALMILNQMPLMNVLEVLEIGIKNRVIEFLSGPNGFYTKEGLKNSLGIGLEGYLRLWFSDTN